VCVNISSIKRIFSNQTHYFPDTPCITRLSSNEIFSPSNKIHREVGRAKDLSAPWYLNWHLLKWQNNIGNKYKKRGNYITLTEQDIGEKLWERCKTIVNSMAEEVLDIVEPVK